MFIKSEEPYFVLCVKEDIELFAFDIVFCLRAQTHTHFIESLSLRSPVVFFRFMRTFAKCDEVI